MRDSSRNGERAEGVTSRRPSKTKLERLRPDITERKKVEEALQHSKKEWVETFNAISDWVVMIDLKGRILRTNRIGEKFVGVPLDEIIGQLCCKLVHGSEKHIPCCPLKKMLKTGHRESAELQVPDTDRWLMVTVDPVTDEEEQLIGAAHITRDITDRKKAEKALQKSEEHYRMLAETMNDGLEQIDETGRYIYVNKKLGDILGYSPEEIVGRHWTDFFDENAQKTIKEQLFKREKGIAEPYEVANTRRDGERIFIRISPQTIFDKDGKFKGSFAILTDITERKKAEEALRRSEKQASAAVEAARGFTFNYDIATGKISWSGAIEEITGYTPEEFAQVDVDGWVKMIHPDDRDKVLSILQKAIDELDRATAEYQFRTKNGGYVTLSSISLTERKDGKAVRLVGILQDITERKVAGEKITMLAKFPAENPNPVLRISADGTILYANKDSSVVLETWQCSQGRRIPEPCRKRVEEALKSGKVSDFEFTCNNGQIFSVTLAPVVESGYVNAYGLDITERKKAEEGLLDYQSQLKSLASQLTLAEEHERHRIATELHDQIGQLLIISKLSLDAARNLGSAADITKALNEADRNIEQIIQNLRSLTFELSSPLLYELGLEKAVAEWLTEKIRKKHRINTEFEDDGQHKPLDDDLRALLFRDVRELLTNVVRHAQAKWVKVSIRKVESRICVTVEDNGWGFDPEKIAATATKAGKFGLFSIRERLKQLGGSIEIESAPGYGTCITLCAPLKQETENLN